MCIYTKRDYIKLAYMFTETDEFKICSGRADTELQSLGWQACNLGRDKKFQLETEGRKTPPVPDQMHSGRRGFPHLQIRIFVLLSPLIDGPH